MTGKTLLHYEIKEQIGKGGMGEVFRARDTKLGRDVALKILPAELSGDPERETRFQREARALASLQHPNVASVYGFEEVDGIRFLVMELIIGSELTDRMERGPIPVEDTLSIARQIAAGLEAHENGIVHRDLKPANIMETNEGEVKILDFGLAQAWFGDDGTQQDSGTAPTMTGAMTQMGAILGTAAYMSPEQARGINVDRRTDIWAFGAIMFEMLTGKPLFKGETISDTLAAVLRAEPDWDSLPVAEAPELCRLIERCLERNPRQRLRDIGEARIFLQDGGATISNLSFSQLGISEITTERRKTNMPVTLLFTVALLCILGGTFLGWKVIAKPAPRPLLHTMLPPPKNTEYDLKSTAPGPAAISPDGTMVTFTAVNDEGITQLYLRHLDQGEAAALSGTETANYPFWSPDNQYIGFFDEADNKLKKVAVGGGPPVTICLAENGKGGSWNDDGQIIFAPSFDSGIYLVPAIGGEPQQVTSISESYDSNRHPRFLPDGLQFLYVARKSGSGDNSILLASLDTTVTPRFIAESQANVEYNQGNLLTVREGVLMATPFEPEQDQAVAGGTPLVENILTIKGAAVAVFGGSEDGMLVYQTGASAQAGQQLSWVDLTSGVEQALGEIGQLGRMRISPDGKSAVVQVENASNEGIDLWLVDLESGLRTRFTFAAGDEVSAVWTPDGSSIIYASHFEETHRLMDQPVEGQGGAAILYESDNNIYPTSISKLDQTLLFDFIRDDGKNEMQRLSLTATDSEPQIVASRPENNLGGGMYSPDGRWIAYHTTSASGWDVFVIPASGGSRKWQISTDGSVYPQWSADGTKLCASRFSGDLRMYEVNGADQTFRVGKYSDMVRVESPDANGRAYDLHPDGQRVLHARTDPAFQTEFSFLHLVTEWQRGLAR